MFCERISKHISTAKTFRDIFQYRARTEHTVKVQGSKFLKNSNDILFHSTERKAIASRHLCFLD